MIVEGRVKAQVCTGLTHFQGPGRSYPDGDREELIVMLCFHCYKLQDANTLCAGGKAPSSRWRYFTRPSH